MMPKWEITIRTQQCQIGVWLSRLKVLLFEKVAYKSVFCVWIPKVQGDLEDWDNNEMVHVYHTMSDCRKAFVKLE